MNHISFWKFINLKILFNLQAWQIGRFLFKGEPFKTLACWFFNIEPFLPTSCKYSHGCCSCIFSVTDTYMSFLIARITPHSISVSKKFVLNKPRSAILRLQKNLSIPLAENLLNDVKRITAPVPCRLGKLDWSSKHDLYLHVSFGGHELRRDGSLKR